MALTPKIQFVEGLVCTGAPVTSWALFFERLCVCVGERGIEGEKESTDLRGNGRGDVDE